MDKRLKLHDEFMSSEIDMLTDELAKKHNPDNINSRACSLLNYHNNVIKYFQHERLIHLLVTFFFAILSITSTILTFVPNNYHIENLLLIISAILFVVEIFYVKYYYYLENGTQKLYKYSKVLFDIIQKTN